MIYNPLIETWENIPYGSGLYQASTFGRFKRNNKILNPYKQPDGYLKINLHVYGKVKQYYAQVLIWDTFNEEKSVRFLKVVDHKDEDKANNALSNLQLLTTRQNISKSKFLKNKTSKYTGVSFDKKLSKWRAAYRLNGKSKYIGYFADELAAHEAYLEKVDNI